ncbi:MAG: PID-CTERM protein-sorting domain-containing protein [Mesonia hippocampi]|uniref:Uncharacterized protein n=1 Tax=Mesonia hippocampi TaxID=1628250 RepID=A0A840ER77_9FLAO|nr:hypothetical protein [Mesonia hippocampi]MBB4119470.1 hypothetical protein [Mesonia hippocampi]
MKAKYIFPVLVIALLLVATSGYANPFDEIIFENDVDDAPIDGFIGIAMAIGAYFGVKKLRNRK